MNDTAALLLNLFTLTVTFTLFLAVILIALITLVQRAERLLKENDQ